MDLFHRIDDAEAIIRAKGGVFKQTEVFRRGEQVFVKAAGGFVRLAPKFNGAWGTSNPGVTVIDISQDIPGLFVVNDGKRAPYYTRGLPRRATVSSVA